jgi:tetratricopeptide (TPR) repeat protein
MRVAIYALAKNEAANVERWESSCRDADVRVVTDTGSTDNTVELLEAAGVTVARGAPIPWRWDDAHNLSLMHAPADADVVIRLDLDEALDPGWREALERDWKPETTKLRYWYWWSDVVRFRCDRIHTRNCYRWTGATHEGLVRWDGEEVQTQSDGVVIRHHRQPGKTHKTDLTLLRQAVRENPADARMQWYFARELDYADDAACVEEFQKYLAMPGGAANERAYARRVLARRDERGRARHMLGSMLESPLEPEAYAHVAELAWSKGDAVGALYWARQALNCSDENRSHASDPAAYGEFPADVAYSAAYKLGLMGEAISHAKEAARRNPGNQRHADNVLALERMEVEEGPKP